jgi:hypothetical protein
MQQRGQTSLGGSTTQSLQTFHRDNSAERYKDRLNRQVVTDANQPFYNGSMAANRTAQPPSSCENATPTDQSTCSLRVDSEVDPIVQTTPATAATLMPSHFGIHTPPSVQPTGLASLDFDLPTRGVLYRFTMPRGESHITARAFSNALVRRLMELAAVVLLAMAAWFVVRCIRKRSFAWLATPIGSTLLLCLGLLSICSGILPIIGWVAIVAACGLLVRCRVCRCYRASHL